MNACSVTSQAYPGFACCHLCLFCVCDPCFSCQKRKTLPTYIQKPRSGLCQHVPCQECTSRCTCTTPGHAKAGPHRHLVTPAHPAPRQYHCVSEAPCIK